jgi:hypothetical protein
MTRALKSVPGMGTVGTSGTERGGYDRNRLQGRAFPVSSHGSRHDAQGAGGTVGSTGGNLRSGETGEVPGETREVEFPRSGNFPGIPPPWQTPLFRLVCVLQQYRFSAF